MTIVLLVALTLLVPLEVAPDLKVGPTTATETALTPDLKVGPTTATGAALMPHLDVGRMVTFGGPAFWPGDSYERAARQPAAQDARKNGLDWQPLFDGKTLTNWTPTQFGGEGAVKIEDGQIILEMGGGDLTGVTWTGAAPPTTNYELGLQARRLDGHDFFAGVTFPVGTSFCSLILGGWGGTTVGLSSINGRDASENDTTQSIVFETGRWYDVRIRVTPAKIEAWLDGRQIINQDITGKTIDTRMEVDPSRPLGIAAWRTKSGLRDIRMRKL